MDLDFSHLSVTNNNSNDHQQTNANYPSSTNSNIAECVEGKIELMSCESSGQSGTSSNNTPCSVPGDFATDLLSSQQDCINLPCDVIESNQLYLPGTASLKMDYGCYMQSVFYLAGNPSAQNAQTDNLPSMPSSECSFHSDPVNSNPVYTNSIFTEFPTPSTCQWNDIARTFRLFGFTESVPPEDIMEPTLTPETHFCAENDAECLERSLGMFVYYERIIAIMGGRSVDQRVAIVQKYQSMYKEDLSARFPFESKGCLIDCLVKLCYTPEEFDAIEIRRAMRGADTDEDTIIEILCSRTNEHIRRIKQVYPKLFYGRDLQNDANNDTVHPFKRICIALLKADRDEFPFVNGNVVRSDAEELFTAVNQHGGMDESKLIPILTTRSYVHLRAVFNEYSTLGECNMEEDLKSNMHEPTLSCLLSIVCCIQNRPKYFATKLWNIMKSTGINDNTVMMRIIISRCEIDMKQILNEFDSLNGKSLKECLELECKQLEDENEIRISKSRHPLLAHYHCDETPIHYRRLLLRLIGA